VLNNDVFEKTPSREGYASFPKFERNILRGVDYRGLHKWLREPSLKQCVVKNNSQLFIYKKPT